MMNLYLEAEKYAQKLVAFNHETLAELPEDLVCQMAHGNHLAWVTAKKADGWTYGEDNDQMKTSSILVEFDQLPDEIRKENERNAREAVALLLSNGVVLTTDPSAVPATDEALDAKIDQIVEAVHDSWSFAKLSQGWQFGETTDKANHIHRDLLPFNVLMQWHPEDASYDFETVRGAFKAAKDAGYVVCIQ